MPVPADQDVGAGPMGPQRGQQPDEAHGICGPCGAGARAEGGGHEGVGGAVENAQRQRTMVLLVMMIAGQLLRALGGSIALLKLAPDSRRRLGGAGNTMIS